MRIPRGRQRDKETGTTSESSQARKSEGKRMLYDAESGDFRIIVTGDSIITRSMSVFHEPDFLELVEVLRGSDVTVTNAEILFHDYEDAPTTVSGGTYMRAEPRLIEELRFLGVDMVACANNHAYDFGENGVLTNIANLERQRGRLDERGRVD